MAISIWAKTLSGSLNDSQEEQILKNKTLGVLGWMMIKAALRQIVACLSVVGVIFECNLKIMSLLIHNLELN